MFAAKNSASMDCVAMLNEMHYISGDQNGCVRTCIENRHCCRQTLLDVSMSNPHPVACPTSSLLLWDMNRKKPCYTLRNAHGDSSWICSIATVPYSDLIASGTLHACR